MKMLTTGMQGVAHLAIEQVNLQATLGGYELAFSVQGQTVTPDPKYWTLTYGAEVQVGAIGQLQRLGVARPDSPLRIRTAPTAVHVALEFRLPIMSHQLSIIEGLRENGNLEFKLVISGEGGPLDHPDRVERLHDDFWKEVGRSDWIAQLATAKFTDILLLETPMPFVDPPEGARDMMEALRRAQALFHEGRFPESISACRTAMAALATREDRGGDWSTGALDAFKSARKDMSKEQRELALEAALLHFAHLGAHPDEVQIDRRDAKLAIALTASVLAFRAA